MIQNRVADIRDILVIIDSILTWERVSNESRQQLLLFKRELEAELRTLVELSETKAA